MIRIERACVMNLENAIRGARNPLNSWGKSDSYYDENGYYILGENDIGLGMRLCRAGSDHRKFIRQILVSVDITAPMYWWKEFDTYKVGTVANSTSTMHKIQAKEFCREDFSHDRMSDVALACLDGVIACLEERRLPPDIDYFAVPGLRTEARQKLSAVRPESFGRAGRISGVSPADMAALMVYLRRDGR